MNKLSRILQSRPFQIAGAIFAAIGMLIVFTVLMLPTASGQALIGEWSRLSNCTVGMTPPSTPKWRITIEVVRDPN